MFAFLLAASADTVVGHGCDSDVCGDDDLS